MSALLLSVLSKIPYNLSSTYEDNVEFMNEDSPEYLPSLDRSFPVKSSTLTIYYEYFDELVKTTYVLPGQVTPKEILQSISNFYQQELTQDNVDYLVGHGYDVKVGEPLWESLGNHVFFEGLLPHEDGFRLNLGS